MDYAINILKGVAYKLEKSRDNLELLFSTASERLKVEENEESRKILEEVIRTNPIERSDIGDKLDSLYSAILYLSDRLNKNGGDAF